MKQFSGLDTLMASNAITSTASFEAYYKDVLSRMESQGENFEGFEWGRTQLDFTYEMLQAERQIEVMASYVDLNSPALPAGKTTKLSVLSGTIPRQKYAIVRGENDYRKELITINEMRAVAAFYNVNERTPVREYLAKTLFDTVSEIPAAHKNSMNYQIGQMKSLGAVTLTDANNPRGSIRATFTAQVPTDNFIEKKWFEKDTDGTISAVGDPVADLREKIADIRWGVNGYQNVAVEMNERWFYSKLLKHSAVQTALGYAMSGLTLRISPSNDKNAAAVTANVTDHEVLKNAFKQAIGADEVILNGTRCGVEKINTTNHNFDRTLVDAFNEDVVLIRPTGTIGVIKNVAPLRPDGSAITASLYGGRGFIEYIYDPYTRTQTWRSELTALAVPTRPNDLYYFKKLTQDKPTQNAGS